MRNTLIAIILLWIPVLDGLAQAPVPAQLVIAPDKIDFGRQPMNSQSQPAAVTITNRSSTPITLEEILSSGIDFPSQNGCGKQLASGDSCSIQISFKPAITGDRTGILQITASDSPNSHFVPLSGTGQ